ncbi:Eukaryotic translation initiation factor 4 gamma 3 [Takifugu flavidus]|uniref:Eukaryotic translation initiation factor 4 gamma 3 n=1 Tax=Takifugu flavidus TaxID=433684 RepID=A0A5C6PM93_9TELE|nr:Eukaryotic translation initiation factor 4 gamma 3 [Takifugu flavidus]
MTKKEKGKNKKKKIQSSYQALEKLHIRFTYVGQHITGGQIPKDNKNVCKPAWKEDGSKCVDATFMKKATKETLDILQRVLHKITPERFGRLMQQVKYMKINTEERLKGAIELILGKAASEPAYCAT